MTIAVVDDLVVRGRKLLEALCSYGCEVAFEISEVHEDHSASSDETVYQRLLRHVNDDGCLMDFTGVKEGSKIYRRLES